MGGRLTSLNLLHLSNPQLRLQGWQAGRLARQNVTAERSRIGAISFHPTLPRVLQRLGRTQQRTLPSAFAATPRSWSGAKESGDRPRSISCTSPAMVFHRQTSWPRAIRQDYWAGHRNMWSNLPLPLFLTHDTQDLRDLFQPSTPPHAQARLGCANPPARSPRLSQDNKTLGHRHNNLFIQALSLTSKEMCSPTRLQGNNQSIKSIWFSNAPSSYGRPCHGRECFTGARVPAPLRVGHTHHRSSKQAIRNSKGCSGLP